MLSKVENSEPLDNLKDFISVVSEPSVIYSTVFSDLIFLDIKTKNMINIRIKSKGKIPGLFNLIKVARNNMWEGQNRNNMIFDYNLYIENSTSKEIFEIPTNKNEVNEVDKLNKQKPFLKLKLDQDTLLEWLLGYEDFNMLDSGHRISFLRKPNDYKVEAYFILSLFRL